MNYEYGIMNYGIMNYLYLNIFLIENDCSLSLHLTWKIYQIKIEHVFKDFSLGKYLIQKKIF